MPNAATHDSLTLLSGAGLAAGVWSISHDLVLTSTIVTAHLISGLWFSPDLDLAAGSYRRWGPFRALWLPYALLVPHRSWLSHSLIVGPLLRLLYFGALLAIFLWFFLAERIDVGIWTALRLIVAQWLQEYRVELAAALIGFITGSAVHSLADMATTTATRKR